MTVRLRGSSSKRLRGFGSDAGRYVGQNWPELLGVLFHASRSPDAGQREGAFRIFATTPGIIEKQHEDTVLEAFTKGFKDEDVTVRGPSSSDQRACTHAFYRSVYLQWKPLHHSFDPFRKRLSSGTTPWFSICSMFYRLSKIRVTPRA